MRIHCLENVDKALQFLKEQRVHLENMGSHDIVDGNHRLTLGLIWTIILRFQVRELARRVYLPPGYEHLCEARLPPFSRDWEDPVEMASWSQMGGAVCHIQLPYCRHSYYFLPQFCCLMKVLDSLVR